MNWKTLLVPHDYSPGADRALAEAAALARHHDGRLVLVHVTHLPSGLHADAMLADPNSESGEMIRVDAYARMTATAKLEAIAAPLRATGVDVECRATVGEVDDEILAAARDAAADVIVMGTHGRTGIAHLLLGSMTEKVLRRATIPVLTVRVAAAD